MADIEVKRGDTSPSIVRVLKDASGVPVDLTGASVRFLMKALADRHDPSAEVFSAEATIDQDLDEEDEIVDQGQVSYGWSDGGTEIAGGYRAEFEVTFEGDDVETFPNGGYLTVAILADLGSVETS